MKRLGMLHATPKTKRLIPLRWLLRYATILSKKKAYPTQPDAPANSMIKRRYPSGLLANR